MNTSQKTDLDTQISTQDLVRFVFKKLSKEKMEQIEQMIANDHIQRDFVTTLEKAKMKGETAEQIIQEIENLPETDISKVLEKFPLCSACTLQEN